MADKGKGPEFDYSNYSRADQRDVTKRRLRGQWLSAQMDEHAGELSRKEYDALMDESMALMDEIEAESLAYATFVPRDWFVTSAPDGVSIKTPKWWLKLRVDKKVELLDLAREALSPSAASGE